MDEAFYPKDNFFFYMLLHPQIGPTTVRRWNAAGALGSHTHKKKRERSAESGVLAPLREVGELSWWCNARTMLAVKGDYLWQCPLRFRSQRQRFSGSEIFLLCVCGPLEGSHGSVDDLMRQTGRWERWLNSWVTLTGCCRAQWWAKTSLYPKNAPPTPKIMWSHKLLGCLETRWTDTRLAFSLRRSLLV